MQASIWLMKLSWLGITLGSSGGGGWRVSLIRAAQEITSGAAGPFGRSQMVNGNQKASASARRTWPRGFLTHIGSSSVFCYNSHALRHGCAFHHGYVLGFHLVRYKLELPRSSQVLSLGLLCRPAHVPCPLKPLGPPLTYSVGLCRPPVAPP